ncbi:MAG: RNA polymerase sigma factor [Candidatus Eisenbacteria bacterium]|uniref:RNA polymerase sigma factor n=1 Tax=Eiseniibacteriota bacterium TaxID=2212470 RepID=A0A849SRP7_UNCEI|nr:RNA polymerase sigma factor [Candidatus Eisenbacteria bacterium]
MDLPFMDSGAAAWPSAPTDAGRAVRPDAARPHSLRAESAAAEAEREVVERARGGDQAAFRVLVERHRDRAYGLALRIVRDSGVAEEVAQDAFVRAWRALPGFRGEAAFSTWLHRIVVRRALDRAVMLTARRAREIALEHAPEPIIESVAGRAAAALATAARLEGLIEQLSPMQRAAVTLFYYHDRSVLEVASVLELPENTVKTHLSRARAALREAWVTGETS